MSKLNVGNLFNENEDGAPVVSGISTFSSPYYFVPPSGSTAQRPSNPSEGMLRFNTDSGHLEYYNSELWVDVITNNNQLGVSTAGTVSPGGTGTRAAYMGGGNPAQVNDIDYITIETLGNSQDFGDLAGNERGTSNGQAGSRVRGLAMGGSVLGYNIDHITFASTGSAVATPNLFSVNRRLGGGVSNQTRALFAGGMNPTAQNAIDLVAISSLAEAQDFGDLSVATYFVSGTSSSVRGIYSMGRESPSPHYYGEIEYVTISSTGNAQDFGNLSVSRAPDAGGNSVRGIFCGGQTPSITGTDHIDFMTIASTGNAQDFGDLVIAKTMGASVTSPTRCVHISGKNNDSDFIDEMEYVTIMTTGNALEFGELVGPDRFRGTGASNGHGGL